MALSLLPPQREGRAHVRGAWLGSTGQSRCTAWGPSSSANMIRDILVGRTLVRPIVITNTPPLLRPLPACVTADALFLSQLVAALLPKKQDSSFQEASPLIIYTKPWPRCLSYQRGEKKKKKKAMASAAGEVRLIGAWPSPFVLRPRVA
ncbi:hypothetical protein BHM03_00058422, partial [Ensete ventricosum]